MSDHVIAAIREQHLRIRDPRGEGYFVAICNLDEQPWPCHAARVLAALDAAEADALELFEQLEALHDKHPLKHRKCTPDNCYISEALAAHRERVGGERTS